MGVTLGIRNDSSRKRVVRRDRLERLAERMCAGEGLKGETELSVYFCDDAAISELNARYGDGSGATDVLSFEQPGDGAAQSRLLGDIVISLETAERNCGGDRALLRREVDLLFCHGLLHLLGYDHDTERARARMQRRQANYLGVSGEAAWAFGMKAHATKPVAGGGLRRVGR